MSAKDVDLWAEVREAREMLRHHEDYPVLDAFETAWQILEQSEISAPVDRDGLSTESNTPLSLLMFYTEMGSYPPPELLLGLLMAWERYLMGFGKLSLEEAFLGKVKRGAGNYAKRATKDKQKRFTALEVRLIQEKYGASQVAAIEKYLERHPHEKREVESIEKMFKRQKATRKRDKKAR